jgi:alcohol dehydrogenase class IV
MGDFDADLDAVDGRIYGEDGFRFEYQPGTIRFGRGSVDALADELAELGADSAVVVTGRTVGTTPAVMDPVRDGLGDALAAEFPETTPQKRIATAHAAAERLADADADAFVAVGGGSSLDVTKAARVIAARDLSHETAAAELAETGTLAVPDSGLPPAAVVPTTLAGADLSQGAGISAAPDTDPVDEHVGGGVSDPALMPSALHYDPDLFATTPRSILAASAMNGLDKAIESLYAGNATPVTDAVAVHGLRLCREGLPALGCEDYEPRDLERAVLGIVLAQYGVSRPDGSTLSLVHAFGHGLTHGYDVHQGRAHAAVAPHALRYLFEHVDGRRDLLAEALAPDAAHSDTTDAGEAAISGLTAIRNALRLPRQIRDLEDHPARGELRDVAAYVADDAFMENAPPGLDTSVEELHGVLDAAW